MGKRVNNQNDEQRNYESITGVYDNIVNALFGGKKMHKEMQREKELNGISLLRVITVCMILIVHFGQSLSFPAFIHMPIVWCQHGVQLFFLISGFLIFKSLDRDPDIKRFYKKRILRIIPVYYAVIIINIIVFSLIFKSMPTDELHIGWLRYFLFLQTWLPAGIVDAWNNKSALWTMSAFAFFYVLAPLLHKLMKSYKSACAAVVASISVSTVFTICVSRLALSNITFNDSLAYLSGKSPLAVLWIFLIGACDRNEGYTLFAIAIWGMIYGYTGATMVVCFAWILAKVQDQTFDFGKGLNKIIHIFDEYSFSIYLAHTTALEIFSTLRDMFGLNTAIVAGASVVLTLVLVIVLHNFVEVPFSKIKFRAVKQ